MTKKRYLPIDNGIIKALIFVIVWMSGVSIITCMASLNGKASTVDIGLFYTDCGDFEVKAKPQIDLTGTNVTNIQFTIRWPENSVNLINFTSAFNIVQQGPVYVSGGFNYAIFISATPIPINWTAGNEYTLLSFSHDQSGTGYADFIIADDAWTLANNGIYYFEILGLDETGIIYQQADNTWLGPCGKIDAGIFNTGCDDFEVRLKPHDHYPNNVLTNLQFTISWPENTVNLVNFNSTYNVQQQGPVYTDNGNNYAIFISATPIPIAWTAETEYTVMTFNHDQSWTGNIDIVLSSDSWTQTNNGTYFTELLGIDKTGILYHQAEDVPVGPCQDVDIGIFNTACGDFEIRAKPLVDFMGTSVTNIQFTIRWPENSANLIDFTSAFGIVQQGPVYVSGGFNYAIFVSATPIPINWTAENEYTLLSFSHDQSGSSYGDVIIADDAWTLANNGTYYFEVLGINESGIIYHQADNTWLGPCDKIDAGIFSTGCGDFEVRLKPHDHYPENVLTNLQFTISWPENTVNLENFSSTYNVLQQGPVYNDNGNNYAIFISATPIPIAWTAETEYTVLTFNHDQSGTGYADFILSSDIWTQNNNGLYYTELLGMDYTGFIYHIAENTYIGECGIVDIKVILQGGYLYGTGLMNTAINLTGNLPLNHPYNVTPWNYAGTESMTVFPDSIVDWILIELRDKTDASLVIETRVGLLSKSGIVLDTNLTRGVHFNLLSGLDTFYLVVKHRNHMPVMSGEPVSLPNLGAPYDFTEVVITQPYKHLDPLPTMLELNPPGSVKYGMVAGDINADGILKYIGSNNDRAFIVQRILNESGLPYLNTVVSGYFNEDITLDNNVKYIGASNDRALILSNLVKLTGLPYLHTVYNSIVP